MRQEFFVVVVVGMNNVDERIRERAREYLIEKCGESEYWTRSENGKREIDKLVNFALSERDAAPAEGPHCTCASPGDDSSCPFHNPPLTMRQVHEDAAGMNLCPEFFRLNNIDPDAPAEGPRQVEFEADETPNSTTTFDLKTSVGEFYLETGRTRFSAHFEPVKGKTQYYEGKMAAQPSPDAAKVEEIAAKCCELAKKKFNEAIEEEGPAPTVFDIRPSDFATILRPYFPEEKG